MFDRNYRLANFDEEIWQAIEAERVRQEDHVELIASENYASPCVRSAGFCTYQ